MLTLRCAVNNEENLQVLRSRKDLCDIVIVNRDGQETYAHSCILTSHSTVIATILQNRLAAHHNWSIFQPLIINIDEVGINSSEQEVAEDVNFVEVLIRLMYGEEVDVSDFYVSALNEYAHILGLTEQFFTNLDGAGKDIQLIQPEENIESTNTVKEVVFSVDAQERVSHEEYDSVELNKIDLTQQTLPVGLSKSPQKKQTTDDSVIESIAVKDKSENVVSISLFSTESEDGSSIECSKEELIYENDASIQTEDCKIVVHAMDQCDHEESITEHISGIVEDSKDENIFDLKYHPSNTSNVPNSPKVQHDRSNISNVPDSPKVQHLQKQKKQPQKSFVCTTCGSAFQKCSEFVQHVRNMQHYTVHCPLCFTQAEKTADQRLHFALHDEKLPFFCMFCDMRFRTRGAFTLHIPKHKTPDLTDERFEKPTLGIDDPGKEISYRVIDGGTQRAKRMLIDSKGFTYTVKRQKGANTKWRCSLRKKTQRCSATVSQVGDYFNADATGHCHSAKQGVVTASILSKKVKQEASKDFKATAPTIVGKVVSECVNLEKFDSYNANVYNSLLRKANNIRNKMREEKSSDQNFELNLDFLPSTFLRKDIIIENQRHLVFATSTQLKLLRTAKMWYLDGNCSVPCEPFVKIFVIRTFLNSEEDMNQAALSYVLMSRCLEKDYKEVFVTILNGLLESPDLKTIIADFEKPLWRAAASIFPKSKLQGCAFYWGKAVWRKAQKLGIKAKVISRDDKQQTFINKVLALPFLPCDHIESAFKQLCDSTKGHKRFESLMEYIDNTWISSSLWTAASWNVFKLPIRTCSDIEGWQHRLNEQLHQVNPVVYNVIWLLLQEAETIPPDSETASEDELILHQKKRDTGFRSKIFSLWDSYLTETISSNDFLKKCGSLYSPEITMT